MPKNPIFGIESVNLSNDSPGNPPVPYSSMELTSNMNLKIDFLLSESSHPWALVNASVRLGHWLS